MTAPTDISPDPDLEDQVRAMLARRAGDVAPGSLDPRLPEGVRIALVDERSPRRAGPARWLTAAAVVVVLAAVTALLWPDDGRGADEEATARTTPETTTPGWSGSDGVIPGLPAGIGVAHLLPLWDPGADGADLEPGMVATQYLADRIGPAVTVIAASIPPADAGLVTVTWAVGSGWTTPLGSVHLERRDGRWQVIAATAPDVFDVTRARLEDGRLQGVMANRGTQPWGLEIGPADLTVPVQDLAGLVLGMPDDCASPCHQDTGTYIAMPDLVAAGGSALPVELAPIGEPLAAVPHRLQAVTVRDDVELTGGEDPQVSVPAALAFTEIVFDPTVPPVEPGTDPAPGRPEHLASLPLGVDPTVGPIRTIEAWGASPEAAAQDLVVEAFGGLDRLTSMEPLVVEGADPDELWAAHWSSLVARDPVAWPEGSADGGGTVTVRRTDTGWTAVAATSTALDLTAVRYDPADGGLRGTVRATVPAPLQVTVTTLAGEELAQSDLTTDAANPQGPSVLGLDDLVEVTDGQPVLLRVAVGDRPGQVGLDGVAVAGFASVVLPGWSDEGGGVPTTTAPTPPTTVGTEPSSGPVDDRAAVLAGLLPPGVDPAALAPLPFAATSTFADGSPFDRDDPMHVAHAFLADRLPSSPGLIRWTIDPDLVAIEWWPGDGEGPDLGEGSGTVLLRRSGTGWEVVAALSRTFDLRGVSVDDGWPTGEVRSTGSGEWWATVATGDGFTAEQIASIVAYVRSLSEADGTAPGGSPGALPVAPADRGSGPATLYAAMDAGDGAGPFVELSLTG